MGLEVRDSVPAGSLTVLYADDWIKVWFCFKEHGLLGRILTFLADWWPFLLLVYLPRLTKMTAHAWAVVMQHRLDRYFPDELPMTAGEWLKQVLPRTGLGHVQVVTTSKDIDTDGFHPHQHVIQLSQGTYFKRDPIFWGIAAHELGHAFLHSRRPLLIGFLLGARWVKWMLASFGLGIAAGNVLYAMPEATRLAFYCLALAVVFDVFTLIEEAAASIVADGVLRRDGAIANHHLRGARQFLLVALSTYLATFLCHAILLSQWPRLVELTGSGRFDGVAPPLAGWRWVVIALASVVLILQAAMVLKRVFVPTRGHRVVDKTIIYPEGGFYFLVRMLASLGLLALLALVWDQATYSWFWWCVLLAFIPALGSITRLLGLPFIVLYLYVRVLHTRVIARFGRVIQTAEYLAAQKEGRHEARRGDAFLAEIVAATLDNPPWSRRLASLARLFYLPLLVAYWHML